MAKKKQEEKLLERTYTVPLRKEYQKAPNWKRTNKAVIALRQFLGKHMKSDQIKLSKELNEILWKHGIKNPPHKVKVNVTKNKEGLVLADLFGVKKVKRKKVKKETPKVAEKKEETKKEVTKKKEEKEEQKALQKETPKSNEEKLPKVKDEKASQSVPSKKNQLN